MFMGATDEEMRRADGLGIDHVTYALFVSRGSRLAISRSSSRPSGVFTELRYLPPHLLPGTPLFEFR